jgi:hypothetical protein
LSLALIPPTAHNFYLASRHRWADGTLIWENRELSVAVASRLLPHNDPARLLSC